MERDCESELSKLNIEQNACIYHFGASVIHGQRSNILRLRCVDLRASTGRSYRAPESQEVVRVDFHDTDPLPYEQPLNVIPVATERNNLSVAEPLKLSVGSFHLTIPNGTDPQLLAQTLRIVKELEC